MTDLLLLQFDQGTRQEPSVAVRQPGADDAIKVFVRNFPGQVVVWRRAGELLLVGQPARQSDDDAIRSAASSLLSLFSRRQPADGNQGHGGARLRWSQATRHHRAGQPCPRRSPCLFLVSSCVPPSEAEEFDAWYDTEHVPLLLRIPGWRAVERYRVDLSSDAVTHVALHYIDDAALLTHPERTAAGRTDWTLRLARRPWFAGNTRHVYQSAGLTS
jgi:hypothetical protein